LAHEGEHKNQRKSKELRNKANPLEYEN